MRRSPKTDARRWALRSISSSHPSPEDKKTSSVAAWLKSLYGSRARQGVHAGVGGGGRSGSGERRTGCRSGDGAPGTSAAAVRGGANRVPIRRRGRRRRSAGVWQTTNRVPIWRRSPRHLSGRGPWWGESGADPATGPQAAAGRGLANDEPGADPATEPPAPQQPRSAVGRIGCRSGDGAAGGGQPGSGKRRTGCRSGDGPRWGESGADPATGPQAAAGRGLANDEPGADPATDPAPQRPRSAVGRIGCRSGDGAAGGGRPGSGEPVIKNLKSPAWQAKSARGNCTKIIVANAQK
jgi:hypothetical protein